METWRASSRCHEEFMGERWPALRPPWGPMGEELGAEDFPRSLQAAGRGSPPKSVQSQGHFSPASLTGFLLSFFFLGFPFPFRLGAFSSRSSSADFFSSLSLPPSFLLHRTRRVSFIYLFFTPAINTLLGLPSFSM